jgi:hypothetical protein
MRAASECQNCGAEWTDKEELHGTEKERRETLRKWSKEINDLLRS